MLLAKRPGTQQAYDLAGLQSAMERTSAIAGQEHCAERLDRVKPLGRLTFRAIRRCLWHRARHRLPGLSLAKSPL